MSQARQEQVSDAEAVPAAQRGRRSRSPGRPRDPGAEQRILDAAIEEYLESGPAGFTMDGVARRAGVGKSTVYLRWPDKRTLLVEGVLARSGSIEHVDTGSLREDLVQLSGNLLRFLLDPVGFATFRITVESVADPAQRHIAAEVGRRHRSAAAGVFERARERGEHLDDQAIPLVTECLYGAVSMKVLATGLEQDWTSDDEITQSCGATVDLLLPLLRR